MLFRSDTRYYAAFWVFQFSLLTSVLLVINVPFHSLVIASERMNVFSIISIFEVISKLIIVYLLTYSPIDKLISYSLLLFVVQVSVVFSYLYYVIFKLQIRILNLNFNKVVFKEMLYFAGWSLWGNCAYAVLDRSICSARSVANIFISSRALDTATFSRFQPPSRFSGPKFKLTLPSLSGP